MNLPNDEFPRRARELHRETIVIDTHCDTTQRLLDPAWRFDTRHDDGHVNLPRLREGGIAGMFLAVFALPTGKVGTGVAAARAQIEAIHRTVDRHADALALCRTSNDIRRAKREGRVAILIGIEGGHLIENSLDVLREFFERGARYMTLTHAAHTDWADSSGVHQELAPRHGGLTDLGREVIREMNRLGMMVDVSHVSDNTVRDVLQVSRAPILASHSACRSMSPHRRNLNDELIQAMARGGGVLHINFHPGFIDPSFPPIDEKLIEEWWKGGGVLRQPLTNHRTPLSILVDHFEHAIRLVGYDHVGIGSDFDGIPAVTVGMEDCSKLPALTAELLRHGHREESLTKVLGENVLRVMERCQQVSRELQAV